MDIFKNKASGKYFIHIEEVVNDEGLFITPLGELKFLELNLFESQESADEDSYLQRGLITPLQVAEYVNENETRVLINSEILTSGK